MAVATSAGSVLVQVGTDMKGFNSGMSSVDKRLSSFGPAVSRAMKVGVGAFVAGGALALNAAGNFEQSLNVLQAVSHATGGQMKEFSNLAKDLGADLTLPATSAKDAAEAMTELAKGGLSVKDTMAAAKGVLQLSAAAQIDNATAATITARALNAFNLQGSEATRVADILANAANASTGEITDFALGLQQSSAVASQWGLTLNETTAALMEMADAGVVGSDAGTSLKTMLQSLSATSPKAAKQMKAMGVDVFDANGKFVGMKATIGQFSKSLKGMSQEQQTAALKIIFGSDAVRAANIILGKGSAAYDAYVKKTEQSGAAAELAAAKMKGFKGALAGLKSQLETIAINIGEHLIPPATAIISGINNLLADVSAASGFKAKIQVLWDFTTGVADAIRKAIFGGMESAIAGGMSAPRFQTQFRDGLYQNMVQAIQSIEWGQLGSTVKQKIGDTFSRIDWGQVGRALSNGFTKLVTGLAAFVRSVNWAQVSTAIVNGIGRFLAGVNWGALAKASFGLFVATLKAQYSFVYGAALTVGKAVLKGVVAGMEGIGNWVWDKLQTLAQKVAGFAKQIYGNALNVGKRLVHGIGDGIRGAWDWALAQAGELVQRLKDKIIFWDSPPEAYGMKIGARLVGGIGAGMLGHLQSAVTAAGQVVTAIKTQISKLNAEITAINERRAAEDRAQAVRDTAAALAEARKKGEGVAAAVRAHQRALEDIEVAGLQSRLDKQTAAQTRAEAAQQKHLNKLQAAAQKAQDRMGALYDKMAGKITAAFDKATAAYKGPAQTELDLIRARRETEDLNSAVTQAERDLNTARQGGDPEAIVEAERRLARAREDITIAGLETQAAAEQTAWEDQRADLRERLDERLTIIREKLATENGGWNQAMGEISALLNSWNPKFGAAGGAAAAAYAAAFQAGISNLGGFAGGSTGTAPNGTSPFQGSPYPQGYRPFAKGGIITRPTFALAGEKGPEAVVPLKQYNAMLTAPLMRRGGGNTTIHNTVVFPNYGGDKRDITRMVLDELKAIGGRN